MTTTIRLSCSATGAALLAWLALTATADPPAQVTTAGPATAGRVLILENQRTLEGDVERVGDQYRVRRSTGEMWVAALSPDGKVAVTGGMDKQLHVWDAESGKLLRSFVDVEDWPRCAAKGLVPAATVSRLRAGSKRSWTSAATARGPNTTG